MSRLIPVFILIFFTSCSLEQDISTSLKLQDEIPISAIKKSSTYITTASRAEKMYIYRENNNTFSVMLDNKNLISFFKAINPTFITPCGIKVGSTLSEIKKISKKEPILMPGWGYFILLSNGWFAGLGIDNKMQTHGQLSSDTEVVFLFKSIYHLYWYE